MPRQRLYLLGHSYDTIVNKQAPPDLAGWSPFAPPSGGHLSDATQQSGRTVDGEDLCRASSTVRPEP